MIRRLQYITIILLWSTTLLAQQNTGRPGNPPQRGGERPGQQINKDSLVLDVKNRLWSWKLKDDFTVVDTIPVDTITDGFQNYNPMYKESFSNIYLGNIGTPYMSNLLSFKDGSEDFIFLNSFKVQFIQPEDIQYYNTRVPYTNLTYINTPPKSRSEENFSWLFTQNVNKAFNIGFNYKILSSVGSYEASQTDKRNFNIHLTYKGPKYSVAGALIYNKVNLYENGGIEDEDYVVNYPYYKDEEKIFSGVEDIFVNYTTQTDFIENFQFFVSQGFGIGNIKIKKHIVPSDTLNHSGFSQDSIHGGMVSPDSLHQRPSPPDSLGRPNLVNNSGFEDQILPVATFYHTLNAGLYNRAFKIDDLDDYVDSDDGSSPLYDQIYGDEEKTRDSTRYTFIANTFQLRFNEEANSFFKFGIRAFLKNEISLYKFQVEPKVVYDEDEDEDVVHYKKEDKSFVNTFLGGQIFKNLGENFWWNAGGKFYFQGYKAGDLELQGHINTLYPVMKDTAGVYARGKIRLHSASYLQENYYGNNIKWEDNDFNKEKLVDLEFGVQIPTRNLKLSWESKTMTDYLYWNSEALPDQTSKVISAFQVTLLKKIDLGPFHSNNSLAYQYSSNQTIYPLPEFAGYSSNYIDFYLANRVLQVQFGVDVRYYTAYYTPAFMPATGQYYVQTDKKYGDYPFLDVFLNLHLKRARVFIKADHINQSFMDRNYFYTAGYAHEPLRIKWGVSWNFYD